MSKIVFINSLGLGGAERVVSRLFSNSDFATQVILWTLDGNDFYKSHDANHTNFKRAYFFSTIMNVLLELLKLDSTTIVQTHLNKPTLMAGISKLIGSKFYFQTVHCFGYSGFYSRKGLLGYLHKFIFSIVLKKVDLHIFKSHEMVGDFIDVFGWKPTSYKVIYNPYDMGQISNMSDGKVNINSSKDDVLIDVAVVGRLSISKRPYDVLDIAKETSNTARYHFFGDGPLRKELEESVEINNIKNVIFHGRVDNPFKYLKSFGFYLSCSESEGFPNSLIEAMLCNAIPIHSDCKTGPKEILCEDYLKYKSSLGSFTIEKRGILFSVGDKVAAIKAICYAADYQCSLKAEFNNSNESFLESLNIDIICDKYKEVFLFKNKP